MIKFFRDIRQHMIKENKATKYLLYAVGEIILVVIGILIALQINNWNEIRKEKLRIVNYLYEIKDDLDQDMVFFKKNLEQYDSLIKFKEWGMSYTKYDYSQKNSLLKYRFSNYTDTKILDIAFNKMMDSGLSEFYDFETIVNQIRRYYLIDGKKYNVMIDWDKRWTDHELLWFLNNDDNNFEMTIYDYPTINSDNYNINELIKSLEDPKGRNWMRYSLLRKREMYRQFKSMLENAEKLKFSIGLELDDTKD